MNAEFDKNLTLKSDRLTIAARGPCIEWEADDVSAVIKNVTITQGSVVASSAGSTTVQKAAQGWSLDASTSSKPTPVRADAHATVTETNGTTYQPPCYYDVQMQPSTP